MTGAIEFLRKAKVICKSREDRYCGDCPVINMCHDGMPTINESDLVRKVMDYQIKERTDEAPSV